MSLETINFNHFELAKGQRMLDLGCGEGRHSITAWLLAEVQVIGLDLSKADLSTAQTRLQDFDAPTERIHFIQGSAFSLPFPDNSFDRVICAEVLEHIHAYHEVLREISRVLKPGGVFAVALLVVSKVGGAVVAAVALLAAVTVHLVAKLEGESHMKLIILSKISWKIYKLKIT